MCLTYTCTIFIFFNLRVDFSPCRLAVSTSAAEAHGIIVLLKKSISYFMNILYNHIFLNFGVISFINKEIVSFFQLTEEFAQAAY